MSTGRRSILARSRLVSMSTDFLDMERAELWMSLQRTIMHSSG
jgi:hypothetical protein